MGNDEKQMIWLPVIIFENTETMFSTLNDEKTFTIIKKEGDFVRNSEEILSNNFLYSGAENTIIVSRNYDQEFICNFNIANYPFDIQKCTMEFITTISISKLVQLNNGQFQYLGKSLI